MNKENRCRTLGIHKDNIYLFPQVILIACLQMLKEGEPMEEVFLEIFGIGLVTRQEIQAILKVSKSWIYQQIAENRFPPPLIHVGREPRWSGRLLARFFARISEEYAHPAEKRRGRPTRNLPEEMLKAHIRGQAPEQSRQHHGASGHQPQVVTSGMGAVTNCR